MLYLRMIVQFFINIIGFKLEMINVMKGFTGLGGFFILVIGLIMLGVTIWGFTNAALTFNSYTFLGILLAMDFIIIFASILGICGAKRQNGFLLCVFQIFVLIFFFAFAAIGISSFVLPKTLFDGNCANSNNQLIQLAHGASKNATLMFCTICPCGLTNQSIADRTKWSAAEAIYLNALNRAQGGPLNFQSCDISRNANQSVVSTFSILQSVEYALDCSGWCQNETSIIYRFSDVNRGKPIATCYDSMKNKLSEYGNIVGLFAFVTAAFLMAVCICGLCLCLAPQRKSMPMASRFIVNDGGYYRPMMSR